MVNNEYYLLSIGLPLQWVGFWVEKKTYLLATRLFSDFPLSLSLSLFLFLYVCPFLVTIQL